MYGCRNRMEWRNWKLLAGALGVIMGAAFVVLWIGDRRRAAPPALSQALLATSTLPKAIPNSITRQSERLGEVLCGARAAMEAAQDAHSKQQQLTALRQALSSSSTNEVSTAI